MNRIVLIGNGFDLAHGLKTSYADFIDWYWEEWGKRLRNGKSKLEEDCFCSFKLRDGVGVASWSLAWSFGVEENPKRPWTNKELVALAKEQQDLCTFKSKSDFFEKICNHLQTKKWVDIEDIYYAFLKKSFVPKQLNGELDFIRERLIAYLTELQDSFIKSDIIKPVIRQHIFAPLNKEDIAISSKEMWTQMIEQRLKYNEKQWERLFEGYNLLNRTNPQHHISTIHRVVNIINYEMKETDIYDIDEANYHSSFLLPDSIMLLNFNYTRTANMYLPDSDLFTVNHIHGKLSNPDSVIFGYGDERDDEYKVLERKNDNEYLQHIKSFRYLEASNYRDMLSFIESAPYQVCIMGHSCGLSDRTLLATLFEHRNCVSIKPYYHKKDDGTDNYRELVQNIARNFKDPTLMRDRVVQKDRCEPLG